MVGGTLGGHPVHLPFPAGLRASRSPVGSTNGTLSLHRLLPSWKAAHPTTDTPLRIHRPRPRVVLARDGPALPSSPQTCYMTMLVPSEVRASAFLPKPAACSPLSCCRQAGAEVMLKHHLFWSVL